MRVVADASPLIFLGKIRRLGLIQPLFPGEMFVPSLVRREILAPPVPPDEEILLAAFLETCRTATPSAAKVFAAGLSAADNEVLGLARELKADMILADDGLLRRVAEVENIRTMGTLGILLRAVRADLESAEAAHSCLEALIHSHGFRIGIEVYETFVSTLHAKPPSQPGRGGRA